MTVEKELLNYGYRYVIGVDEVGRGALAGPIVGAAVAISIKNISKLKLVEDSKLLTPRRRKEVIFKNLSFVESVSVESIPQNIIDKVGIQACNINVLKRTAQNVLKVINSDNCIVCVDHYRIPDFDCLSITNGEKHCLAIALASVIAKVYRDSTMSCIEEYFPQFSFHSHKGYTTKKHLLEIEKLGPVKIHRLSYKPVFSKKLF